MLEYYFRFRTNRKYQHLTWADLPQGPKLFQKRSSSVRSAKTAKKRSPTATSGQTGSRNMAETAKMNSQPSISYSTSYTLWGLSRLYLAVLTRDVNARPIINGAGLRNFRPKSATYAWWGGGAKMRYFWCTFHFWGPIFKWKFFPLYGHGGT